MQRINAWWTRKLREQEQLENFLVPMASLYCEDDDLAQVIVKASQLSPVDRVALHRFLDERVYGAGDRDPA
ncbi:hypothetical protein CCO03_03930 [Comamonas serinivorans]|uniref:Uncharacterized protein n=1 Tax=Comamonas serinivorans TaxID=1082851 RepID=A0A1Y0EKP9_9BURK|nr:hypothetical protein [Comamonas serinivorans]ARU03939.1 hypothetical protein CCO03_03930 [Comamonas serinivorans]